MSAEQEGTSLFEMEPVQTGPKPTAAAEVFRVIEPLELRGIDDESSPADRRIAEHAQSLAMEFHGMRLETMGSTEVNVKLARLNDLMAEHDEVEKVRAAFAEQQLDPTSRFSLDSQLIDHGADRMAEDITARTSGDTEEQRREHRAKAIAELRHNLEHNLGVAAFARNYPEVIESALKQLTDRKAAELGAA